MSGYVYAEFFRRVQAHQLHVRGRTGPTGCWFCDMLEAGHRRTHARCERISGGILDAHHVLPKRVIDAEHPSRGAGGRWAGVSRNVIAALKMDPRNGILVRRYHHDLLECRGVAIPVAMLPADTLEFVDELGVRWWLENQEARRAAG